MAKASILIPTYNRPKYLQRLLDYFHKYGSDFDIIVADSSSDENKKLNKESILSFPDLNIKYIDKYPKKLNPYNKCVDILNYVEGKYCVFCGDDDFITPKGIKDSVAFLEKNPDFTVAHGRYISFWLKDKKNGEKKFYWGAHYSNQSIIFSDPKLRLIKQLSEYGLPTFYGVFRTDFLKMIYRELLNSKVNLILFGEMLPSMLALIYGKMKCLNDVLYMAQQIDSDRNYCNYWPNIGDFANQSKYDQEYAKFRECLVVHLYKKTKLNIEELKKEIDKAMSMYMKRYYSPNSKRALINKIKHISDILHTPDWIYKRVRLLYKKIFFPQQTDNFFVSLDKRSSKYYGDFDKIRSQAIFYGQSKN